MPKSNISVVIPVYNSQSSLEELIRRLNSVLNSPASSFEIILVDDCSHDRSWEKILELTGGDSRIKGLRLGRNFGQHNALLCGIRTAIYETIVTLDDDLQHPPEEIPVLLRKLDEGFDVVYGTPLKQQHGLARDLASSLTKLALQSSMNVETARQVCAFRAFRTNLREASANYRGPFVSIDVLLTWGTKNFGAVAVRHEPRASGVSHYTFSKLVTHAFNMATGFSTLPLQLASVLGFSFTLFGIFILLYVLIRYSLYGTPVPGFPFLASIIAIFSGVQLFTLGVIGEYLARMHFRIMDKPPYVVREIKN